MVSVAVTSDFDAISAWLIGGSLSPGLLSRGEYGARVGVPRLLNLLDRYNVRATWFIPGHTIETYPDACRMIHNAGHEIGHHGYCHETPGQLDRDTERSILERGQELIRGFTGDNPLGYRSPAWEDVSPYTCELLTETGFLYDSSQMADDFTPYWCRAADTHSTTQPTQFGPELDLVEIPISWERDDFPPFSFIWDHPYRSGFIDVEVIYNLWLTQLDYALEHVSDGVYTLVLHPQVSGKPHVLGLIERFLSAVEARPEAHFVTLAEAAYAWKEMQTR